MSSFHLPGNIEGNKNYIDKQTPHLSLRHHRNYQQLYLLVNIIGNKDYVHQHAPHPCLCQNHHHHHHCNNHHLYLLDDVIGNEDHVDEFAGHHKVVATVHISDQFDRPV